jgi:predicted transcriptional regulator
MKVEVGDDLFLSLDAIAGSIGRSREALIELALDLFVMEQLRMQALVECWESDGAQEFSQWLRGVLKR